MRTPIGRQYSVRGKVYVFDPKSGKMVFKEDRLNRNQVEVAPPQGPAVAPEDNHEVTVDEVIVAIERLCDHLEMAGLAKESQWPGAETAERKLYRVLRAALETFYETK